MKTVKRKSNDPSLDKGLARHIRVGLVQMGQRVVQQILLLVILLLAAKWSRNPAEHLDGNMSIEWMFEGVHCGLCMPFTCLLFHFGALLKFPSKFQVCMYDVPVMQKIIGLVCVRFGDVLLYVHRQVLYLCAFICFLWLVQFYISPKLVLIPV